MFLAFCAFAIDATIVLTTRAKLQSATEASALAAASKFNYDPTTAASTAGSITAAASSALNMWKYRNLQYAHVATSEVNIDEREIRIETRMVSPVFFLSLLGVSGVDLSAKACAKSEKLDVTAKYTGVNWLTTSASYISDIISKGANLNDTAILQPLGKGKSSSIDYSGTNLPRFDLIDALTVDQPLSLGPGGYITIKLPAPIIDKTGPDILINEYGAREGYLVFVGLDNDPTDTIDANVATGPYVQYDKPGMGIRWINISCTGKPEVAAENLDGIHTAATQLPVPAQDKFYGPGYFDIGGTCSSAGGVAMAKYLRIVDDNEETGYVKNNGTWYPAWLYGEASTTTPGADIESVSVLNHVKLLKWPDFVPPTP